MSETRDLKVGLTVLLALVVAIGGIVWLKEISLHGAKRSGRWRSPTRGACRPATRCR